MGDGSSNQRGTGCQTDTHMTSLLLDHPWPLDEALDAGSPAYQTLARFSRLTARLGLQPTPFISQEEFDASSQRFVERNHGRNVVGPWFRFAAQLVRKSNSTSVATVRGNLPEFTVSWRAALDEELAIRPDWRNPEIVVPETRHGDWPQNLREVEIERSDGTLHVRVVAPLEEFETHIFAFPDLDPWAHRRELQLPNPDARTGLDHPCLLPKPACCNTLNFAELGNLVSRAAAEGWVVNGCHRYIPPLPFRAHGVGKTEWRAGKAFPRQAHERGTGYLDFERRVWIWHDKERHWDVQLADGSHLRITHEGQRLRDT
jgi:hypothetical protein